MGIFSSVEKKVKKGISNLGNDIKKSIGRFGDDVKRGITNTAKKARDEINKAGDLAEDEFNKVVGHAKDELNDLKNEAKKELEDVAETVEDELKDSFKEASQKALGFIAGESLEKAVDIAQVLAPDSMDIQIGPVSINVDNIKDRIDLLQKWAKNPPNAKNSIKEFITEFAPTSVSISVSAELAFLVVSSDSLSVGFGATWTTEGFLEKYDDIMRHFNL